jgi:hypothetical protein
VDSFFFSRWLDVIGAAGEGVRCRTAMRRNEAAIVAED